MTGVSEVPKLYWAVEFVSVIEACYYRVIWGRESVSDSISAGMRQSARTTLTTFYHMHHHHYAATGDMVKS
jgi:hypothetical protein